MLVPKSKLNLIYLQDITHFSSIRNKAVNKARNKEKRKSRKKNNPLSAPNC
jgi:hypothetical protein